MQHSATEVRYFSAIRAVLGVLVSLVLLAGCTGFFVIKDFRDQLSENIIDKRNHQGILSPAKH